MSFYNIVLISSYDLICLYETWLPSDIKGSELFLSTYSITRCDRNFEATHTIKDGDVLLAVKLFIKRVFRQSNI